MIAIEHDALRLAVSEDGLTVELWDKARRTSWRQAADGATITLAAEPGQDAQPQPQPLPPGRAWRTDAGILIAEYPAPGGMVTASWSLQPDHVTLTLTVTSPHVRQVTLPGSFQAGQERLELLVPVYQGALVRGLGHAWSKRVGRGGHNNASMGLVSLLGSRGAVTLVPEPLTDWWLGYGETEAGELWGAFEHTPCPVEGWRQPRVIRLYLTDAAVPAVARAYRRFAREQGRVVTWEEKIAAKPSLERLFGSLMAFIGYVHDPDLDYLASVRALKRMGFDDIFLFPMRFAQYGQPFTMAGGLPPIHFSDELIAQLQALDGVSVAPWCWVFEGLDDGSERMRRIFRRNAQGGLKPMWSLDHQVWNMVCPGEQARQMREHLDGPLRASDWLHFDVTANWPAETCFSLDHDHHPGRPLTRREDYDLTRQLMSPELVGDRVVSSEGFNDAFTSAYDIGSVKLVPLDAPDPGAVPVPLTMLVYHDCCVHDAWEGHPYNATQVCPMGDTHAGDPLVGRVGSGEPHLKAAQDALYGLPPSVFPFGKQYAWIDIQARTTYAYTVRLSEPDVREALAAALPVARLHKRLGKLAMTDMTFLSDDRFVQQTTFADGTRVIANLGPGEASAPEVGLLPPHAWRVLDR